MVQRLTVHSTMTKKNSVHIGAVEMPNTWPLDQIGILFVDTFTDIIS